MKYYYNSYRINWADEADFYGFELIDETEIQRRKEICKLAAELDEDCGYRICFGSNEDDDNIDLDIIIPDRPKEITKAQRDSISEVVGCQFGFEYVDYLLEQLYDRLDKDSTDDRVSKLLDLLGFDED